VAGDHHHGHAIFAYAAVELAGTALVGGWYAVRCRVLETARERVGFTGNYPSSPKHH
jgi:hypothetical protein